MNSILCSQKNCNFKENFRSGIKNYLILRNKSIKIIKTLKENIITE